MRRSIVAVPLAAGVLVAAGLLVGLLVGHWAGAGRATAGSSPPALVGSWVVWMGSPLGGTPTGDPIGFVTFTADGGAIFSPSDPAFPVRHGVWAERGEREFWIDLRSVEGEPPALAEWGAVLVVEASGDRWDGAGAVLMPSRGGVGDYHWQAERIRPRSDAD
jgi:hypothetical protein